MRIAALLIGTSLLSACGGGGTQSAGTVPAVAPVAGNTASAHSFVNPTVPKVYKAIAAAHSYQYNIKVDNISGTNGPQGGQLYQGNATTVRDSAVTVDYNPRDAIFDITYNDTKAGVASSDRFQDPAHRTAFGGAVEPQAGAPQLAASGIQYLEHGNGAQTLGLIPNFLYAPLQNGNKSGSYSGSTFFYQKPGTSTSYVTFAGFVRNNIAANRDDTAAVAPSAGLPGSAASSVTTYSYNLSRGLFVFGENTIDGVPKSGTGSFTGTTLASLVFNNQLDTDPSSPTYFQMLEGTANTKVDFGANTFSLDLSGKTFAPQLDFLSSGRFTIAGGATFNAAGKGTIDLVKAGGFLGQFQTAWFVNPDGTRYNLNIAGSSIDGGFYGPKANEVGGSYRIVGGTPDERIDILGVFVGK